MHKLSRLPVPSSVFLANQNEKIGSLAKRVLETFIRFFECVRIVPREYHFLEERIAKKIQVSTSLPHSGKVRTDDPLEDKLHHLIRKPIIEPMIPVHVHISQENKILLYTGIGVLDVTGSVIDFSLHELSIPANSIRHSSHSLHYLADILNGERKSSIKSLRQLAAEHGKSYNQFQSDCKDYFGDTFHQFHLKMKMLDALGDIIFTDYNLKEISYRNNFSNYNNMYFLFTKRYNFPLASIPRILTEM